MADLNATKSGGARCQSHQVSASLPSPITPSTLDLCNSSLEFTCSGPPDANHTATSPLSLAYGGCDALDLTVPDDFTDVTLVVEERNLYTCRGILASASPVWRRMFLSGFKEKDAGHIALPGKTFEDVMELLLTISPAIQKPITGDNVFQILPLANEYQMGKVKWDCETWLLCQLDSLDSSSNQHMKYLSLAQQYNLERLLDRAVERVSQLAVCELEEHPDFAELDKDTVIKILKRRVASLEKSDGKQRHSVDNWRKKCEELEEVLKKLGREKLTIKSTLDEIESAWEKKGSDTRCIDPVHIYGPRYYKCEKCTQQIHTYIQAKVCYLLNKGSTWSGISWPQ